MEILDKKITKIRKIPASLSEIWNKWTSHEGLLTFFGNDNMIEMRLNGPYEIYFLMENPYGTRGAEGCRILSFEKEKMLSFTWNAPPQHKEIRDQDHETWVVIYFRKIDENQTEVELNHLGWLKGKKWDAVYEYFDSAWERVIDSLEKSCRD